MRILNKKNSNPEIVFEDQLWDHSCYDGLWKTSLSSAGSHLSAREGSCRNQKTFSDLIGSEASRPLKIRNKQTNKKGIAGLLWFVVLFFFNLFILGSLKFL